MSGMRLDLMEEEGVGILQNRDNSTFYDINSLYNEDTKFNTSTKVFSYLKCVGSLCSSLFSLCPGCCKGTCNIIIPQGFIGMKTERGQFVGKLRPGFHTLNPLIDRIVLVDMRGQTMDLNHQNVLSRDSVSFSIDAVINYKIRSPESALYKIGDCTRLVQNVAEAALKAVISRNKLSDILIQREAINKEILDFMENKLEPAGLEVDYVETQSLTLASHLESALAVPVHAENRAKGKIIDAQGDLEAAKTFLEASELLRGNEVAMTLQKWELMTHISLHSNCDAIIVPHDILGRVKEVFSEKKQSDDSSDESASNKESAPKEPPRNPFEEPADPTKDHHPAETSTSQMTEPKI